jgi:CheY-like chemotaxis protein
MATLEGTETILVVDDERMVLDLTQTILDRYGYMAILASGAGEALRLFKTNPDVKVDLALIDIVMPRMDGLELAEHLRQIRPQLPIIYMSSYPEWRESPLVKGATIPCIAKPFTSVKLIPIIRTMLGPPTARAESIGGNVRCGDYLG